MTDIKYEILKTVYNNPDRCINLIKLTNLFAPGRVMEATYSIEELILKDYLKNDKGTNTIHLTPDGAIAFESEDEHRKNNAKAESENRRNNTKNNISVIIAVVSTVIALAELLVILFKAS